MNSIFMNSEMTRAILDGRKTQTRRVVKDLNPKLQFTFLDSEENIDFYIKKNAKYQKDEVIWVRESVQLEAYEVSEDRFDIRYVADNLKVSFDMPAKHYGKSWTKKACKIPNGCIKEMARIFLKITDVRVERLEDMILDDIEKEGFDSKDYMYDMALDLALDWWENLWNKTAKHGFKWDDNPYVFIYEFERVNRDGSKL